MQHFHRADVWRQLAERTRELADTMTEAAARHEMHMIAAAYERLAVHATRTMGNAMEPKPILMPLEG